MNTLREARNSVLARIGVALFWAFIGLLLGDHSPSLFGVPETKHNVALGIGAALGLAVGLFAALGESYLALLVAFPAFLFWLIPF